MTGRTPAGLVICLICLASLVVLPPCLAAQDVEAENPPSEQEAVPADTAFKSGYGDVVSMGGATSVASDLKDDDRRKNPVLDLDVAYRRLDALNDLKRTLYDGLGLAVGMDYNLLNQYSSFSTTETHALSGIFRVFGTWRVFGKWWKSSGNLVYRVENRHLISGVTPRDLGHDGGSSLSTATFKEFGWGVTSLYWKQMFSGGNYGFAVGKMDPGDFSDVYPLLTAYKHFMNEGLFNNPSVSLPNQGFGLVGGASITRNWYVSAGWHDANGEPTEIGLNSFFNVGEYYKWIETGWRVSGSDLMEGKSIHVNVWHQDARKDADKDETWGVTLSASPVFESRLQWSPFLRIGYSWQDGGQRVRFIAAGGAGIVLRKSDFAGFAVSWSGPPDSSLRNQLTSEAYYRLQLTHNVQVTPGLQFTINPSRTLETDALWVVSVLRVRMSL
ncbi:MAG: carbohydrate porin [marine benthic group bacterium]|nr:carbohydrate porin [Gemmatimonadota bacterium]